MLASFVSPELIPSVSPVNTFIFAVSNFVAKPLFVLLSNVFTSSVKATTLAFVLLKLVLRLLIDLFNAVSLAVTKSNTALAPC